LRGKGAPIDALDGEDGSGEQSRGAFSATRFRRSPYDLSKSGITRTACLVRTLLTGLGVRVNWVTCCANHPPLEHLHARSRSSDLATSELFEAGKRRGRERRSRDRAWTEWRHCSSVAIPDASPRRNRRSRVSPRGITRRIAGYTRRRHHRHVA